MRGADMRRFWDARAREAPFYFVDNRLDYRDPDIERFWSEGERDLDRLLDAVGATVSPGDTVLDIGCGLGRLSRPLAARAARVVALDVSPEMIGRGRALNAHLDNVEWLAGSGTDLRPIPDASIDACVSHVVFQHIPDPGITLGYIADMGRVLRPGGWATFQVSTDERVHRPQTRRGPLRAVRELLRRSPRGQDQPAWLGSSVAVDDLHAAAAAAGLRVECLVGAGTQHTVVRLDRRDDPPA